MSPPLNPPPEMTSPPICDLQGTQLPNPGPQVIVDVQFCSKGPKTRYCIDSKTGILTDDDALSD